MKKLLYIFIFCLISATASAERVYWYNATSWIGGTESSLDSINGQNLINNDKAIVVTNSGQTYFYNLDTDSALTEDSTNYSVISPDTNAGNKRWILMFKGDRTLIPDSTIDQGDNTIVGTLAWHITSASGNPTTVRVLPGTYKITTSITTPSTMNLVIDRGGIFKPDAAKTLTVYSPGCILASSYQQIVDATSNSTNPLLFTLAGTVYPEWWGAADGNADDTLEVQLALNARGRVILSAEYLVSGVYIRPATILEGVAIHTASSSYLNAGLKLIDSSDPEGVLMTENVKAGFAGDWNMHAIFINNIAIDGNRDNNTTGHGIYQVTSGFINKISNVKIRECSDDAIHLGGEGSTYADKAVVSNVSISGCDGRGIYVDGDTGSTALLLENIKVDDCLRGIYFSGGTGKRLQGVTIINYRSEVSLDNVAIMTSSIEFSSYTGTAIIQNARFFKADSPATRTGGAIKITGNGPRLVLMGISQNEDSDDSDPAYAYILEDTDESITIGDETITFFASPPTPTEIGNMVSRRFDYYYKAADGGMNVYQWGEDYPRIRLISNNIYFGDGAAEPDIDFYRDTAGSWAFGLVSNTQKTSVRMKTTELTGMAGTTETWVAAIPAGSIVLGVTGRVTTLITGATTFDVGESGGDTDLYADGIAVAADTTFNLANSNVALTAPKVYQAETSILVTSQGGDFTAGALRLTLHYITLGAPIS